MTVNANAAKLRSKSIIFFAFMKCADYILVICF